MTAINGKVCVVNGTPVDKVFSDGKQVYGRNLLTGTGNHTVTGTGPSYAYGYLSNETTDDLLTLFKGLEGQTMTVSVDYEYSGFIAGSHNNRIGWEIHIIGDTSSHVGPWYYPTNGSGSGRIFSTFVVPENITSIGEDYGYVQFSGSGTGTVSHFKLEKGSVATPWTPAPEDKVFSNGRQVYGRNLLLGTGNNLIVTGTNTVNQWTHNYSLVNGYNVSSLASALGTQFTVSFDWSVSGSSPSGTFYAQWSAFPWRVTPAITVSSSNTSGYISKTISVSTDSKNVANMLGFRLDNFVGTLTISNLKLEEGSLATPWTPAPEDVGVK